MAVPGNNLVSRLLLFFLAVPALAIALIFFNFLNNLLIVVVVLAFSAGCSWELAWMFVSKGVKVSPLLFVAAGIAIPGSAYAFGFATGSGAGNAAALVLAVVASMSTVAWSPLALAREEEDLRNSLLRSSATSLVILYPGALSAFIVLLGALPKGWMAILAFALVTIANDSFAWLFGMSLGKKRGLVKVSPNKSLAGFLGGIAGSLTAAMHLPIIFGDSVRADLPLLAAFGLVMGIAGIFGDLFESALKRSAMVKDSGSTVPGRGGFLDSFDSQLFTAPFAWLFMAVFGLFTGSGN